MRPSFFSFEDLEALNPLADEAAWQEHLRALRDFTSNTLNELKVKPSRLQAAAHSLASYEAFLSSFKNKLEVLTKSEVVRVLRPHSNSEDNICLNYKSDPDCRTPVQAEIIRLGGSQADCESEGRVRRSSCYMFEDFGEPLQNQGLASNEHFLHTYLGRRRQGSMDY